MTETTSLNEGVDTKTSETKSAGLASLKMTQLQQLASQLGITGGSRMRKADLVKAIGDHQRGGSVAAKDAKAAKEQKPEAEAASAPAEQPKQTKARSRRAPKAEAKVEAEAAAEAQPAAEPAAAEQKPARTRRPSRRATDSGKAPAAAEAKNEAPQAAAETEAAPAEQKAPRQRRNSKKAEAAAHLGVSIRTLERLVRDRELHPVYIRRHPRFTYDDLNELAERNRVGGRHAT